MPSNQGQLGKLLYFDPNPANSKPINNEDLSISVELTANRKTRTIISVTQGNSEAIITGNEKNSLNVNFIKGSKTGGVQSLTTNYTELNTTFGDEFSNDLEGLGISNIDIKFDTSYTPMITIDFVDVRGGSLFGKGNKSDYAVFFDLPYPLFNLTVKGYYGKAVSYCLHLTKWDGKFNSKTGNFEIQAQFIGFTYALLTDTLLGYMRAITETEIGKNKLQEAIVEYEKTGGNGHKIISINELLQRVSVLNDSITKLKDDDKNVKALSDLKAVKLELVTLRERADFFVSDVIKSTSADDTSSVKLYNNKKGLVVVKAPEGEEDIKEYDNFLLGFNNDIKERVKEIKGSTGIDLTSNTKLTDIIEFRNTTKNTLLIDLIGKGTTYESIYGGANEGDTREIVEKIIGSATLSGVADDAKIWFYDLRSVYAENKKLEDEYKEKIKGETTLVSDKLADKAQEILGFKPNIRNIFRIITLHIEIFLECIGDVAEAAENNEDRTKELGRKFLLNGLNIKAENKASGDTTDSTIYPFPQYNKTDGDEGGQETWLGNDADILVVDELQFVEQLLEALLAIKKADIDRAYEANKDDEVIGDDWYPVHTEEVKLDTKNTNPYNTIVDATSHEDFLKVLYLRYFSLNANHGSLNKDLLKSYGKLEAQNMVNIMENEDTKKTLKNLLSSSNTATNVEKLFKLGSTGLKKAKNPEQANKGSRGIVYDINGEIVTYNYIDNSNNYTNASGVRKVQAATTTILPIDGNFDGTIFFEKPIRRTYAGVSKGVLRTEDLKNTSTRFLINRDDSGFEFIDFYTVTDYLKNKGLEPTYGADAYKEYIADAPSPPSSEGIVKQAQSESFVRPNYGLNPFDKKFKLMDYSRIDVKGVNTNAKTLVYQGNKVYTYGLNLAVNYEEELESRKLNEYIGFGSTSPISNDDTKYVIQTDNYKVTANGYTSLERNVGEKIEGFNYDKAKASLYPFYSGWIDDKLGDNPLLLSTLYDTEGRPTKLEKAYIPYCQFTCGNKDGTSFNGINDNAISLFGSKFYYSQIHEASKAYLFLHTFPFFGISEHGSSDFWEGIGLGNSSTLQSIIEYGDFSRFQGNITRYHDMFTKKYPINGLFSNTNGLVFLPKAFILFIGAMLWRLKFPNKPPTEEEPEPVTDPIKFVGLPPTAFNSNNPPLKGDLLYFYEQTLFGASRNEQSAPSPMHFFGGEDSDYATEGKQGYKPIPYTIFKLPDSIKDKFIKQFTDFVTGEWKDIKSGLEIFDGDISEWDDKYDRIVAGIDPIASSASQADKERYSGELSKQLVETEFPNIKDNYINLSPLQIYELSPAISTGLLTDTITKFVSTIYKDITYSNIDVRNNYHLHMKPNTDVMRKMLTLYADTTLIKNNSYSPWRTYGEELVDFKSTTASFKSFLTGFVDEYQKLTTEEETEEKKTKDSLKNKLFNTINDDTIKLSMYRTLSSIYIKWVAGTSNGNLFSQCSGLGKYAEDYSEKIEKRGKKSARLIDTFRFVDRAFNDIGEDLIINPAAFTNLFTSNLNRNAYSLIGDILEANNMDFIPLPTFVDFTDIEEVADMFSPKSYNDVISDRNNLTVGPAFICMYVGQTSTNLDLDKSQFIDDGIFVQPTSTGSNSSTNGNNVELTFLNDKGKTVSDLVTIKPTGGTETITIDDLGKYNTIPIIGVSYAQQNQNFFKDITLNQAEFTETEESLIIIDEIAQQGNTNKKTPIGQNLFNVFQTRSYNATVEAMGNPLIQPMMYFQLNNMPMFGGIYTILSVSHKITPNHMTTSFTGNRIRAVRTPLLENETVYMNLAGSIDATSITGDDVADSGSGGNGSNAVKDGDTPDVIVGNFIDTPMRYDTISPIDNQPKGKIENTIDFGFKFQTHNEPNVYALREVTELLQLAFKDFHETAVKDGTYNDIVFLNDMSRLGGGALSPHKSHQKGVDIDLRQITSNINEHTSKTTFSLKPSLFSGVDKNDTRDDFKGYSRKGTKALINSLKKFAGQVNPVENKIVTIKPTISTTVTNGLSNPASELLNSKCFIKVKDTVSSNKPVKIRKSAEVDNGGLDLIDNVIQEITTPNVIIGNYVSEVKDGIYRWFKIKLTSVGDSGIIFSTDETHGWVRQDDVTFDEYKDKTTKASVINTTLPGIDTIFFNDPVLIEAFDFVKPLAGHTNHMHIKFKTPSRVSKEGGTGENSRAFTYLD